MSRRCSLHCSPSWPSTQNQICILGPDCSAKPDEWDGGEDEMNRSRSESWGPCRNGDVEGSATLPASKWMSDSSSVWVCRGVVGARWNQGVYSIRGTLESGETHARQGWTKLFQGLSLAIDTISCEDSVDKVSVRCQHPREWPEVEGRFSYPKWCGHVGQRYHVDVEDGLDAMRWEERRYCKSEELLCGSR